MAWKKGPLPADTWKWGGVVKKGEKPEDGFRFAAFCGDHVELEDGTKLTAEQVDYYDNSLESP